MTYQEMLERLESEGDEEQEFVHFENEISDDIEPSEDDCDSGEEKKVKESVNAFSVVDRVIHEFVDDQSKKMLVLRDEKVSAQQMLKV